MASAKVWQRNGKGKAGTAGADTTLGGSEDKALHPRATKG